MNIDHCVIAVPDLDSGVEWFETATGVRPVKGGRHEGLGTHNALVSLGAGRYLELIANDPSQDVSSPMNDLLGSITRPAGVGWCLGSDDALATATRLQAAGLEVETAPTSRQAPGGPALSWVTVIVKQSFGGAVPFYIDWLNSPHPSESAPEGCELLDLVPAHPDVQGLRAVLERMDVQVPGAEATRPGVYLRLRTPNGELELGP